MKLLWLFDNLREFHLIIITLNESLGALIFTIFGYDFYVELQFDVNSNLYYLLK
jgi:hypothetical protein